MAVGLATGMGFIGLAVLFVAVVAVANLVYVLSPFGGKARIDKTLRIVVPEDFEYEGAFDGVLSRFASEHELVSVETTNMGSLYQLEYRVRLLRDGEQKKLLDEIRCHNGNLKVSLATTPAQRRCSDEARFRTKGFDVRARSRQRMRSSHRLPHGPRVRAGMRACGMLARR